MRVTVHFEAKDRESAVALIDGINEFGRAADVDVLLARTSDTPSGEPEGAWTIDAPGID